MERGIVEAIRRTPLGAILRDLGRGMVGALLLGMPFVYTMETWWLAWTLPIEHLLVFTLVGLLLILLVIRQVGFREEEKGIRPGWRRLGADFLELFLESALAAYLALLILGVVGLEDTRTAFTRAGLLQIVPLGLGAAVTNRALQAAPAEGGSDREVTGFREELATFTMGALFFALPIAPTEEVPLLAARMGWARAAGLMAVSFLLAFLVLYMLEFRGHRGRLARVRSLRFQVGETFIVYALALVVSAAMLWGFGQFRDDSAVVWVQEIVVLALPASLGGSAAQVVF